MKYSMDIPLFDTIYDYKDKSGLNNGSNSNVTFVTIKFSLLDVERHMFVCNPWGNKNFVSSQGLYKNVLDNLIEFKSNNSNNSKTKNNFKLSNDFSIGNKSSSGTHSISVNNNILNTETTFKTTHSFLLGMVFTSLMAEKCFNAIPLKINHFKSVVNKSIIMKGGTKKYHPDFFAQTKNNKSALVFDAKGSLITSDGYIAYNRIEHGKEQVNTVRSVTLGNKSFGTGKANGLERFIGSVATKAINKKDPKTHINKEDMEIRLGAVDPIGKGNIDFKLDKEDILKDHYCFLSDIEGSESKEKNIETINFDKVKNIEYYKSNIDDITIYSPVKYTDLYNDLVSKNGEKSREKLKSAVKEMARDKQSDFSLGKDGIFLLQKK